MGPYSGEVSSPAEQRGAGGLLAETAGAGLSVCLLPARRRLCWAAGKWRRISRREEERGCGGRRPGRRAPKRRTGEGMKKRREGGDSSEGKRCQSVTLSSLLKDVRNVNHRDKNKKKKTAWIRAVMRAAAQCTLELYGKWLEVQAERASPRI